MTNTRTMTKTNTFRELHQRAILETCHLWDIWSEWGGDMTWPKKRQRQRQMTMIDMWHLRHWLQLRQLRTWIHDNLCYLTIKSDTGQHSQFLRCFCQHKTPFHHFFRLLEFILHTHIWTIFCQTKPISSRKIIFTIEVLQRGHSQATSSSGNRWS